MIAEQESVFWEIIETFDEQTLLQYVMLIGSWAEYIYQHYYNSDYTANLRTRDVDFLYTNLRRPKNKIDISKALQEKDFTYSVHNLTGVEKFSKHDILEIEFLHRILGSGERRYEKIPSIGITGIGIKETNMLAMYPLVIEYKGYKVIVPEPEIYVLHKLLINPQRGEVKKEKDMQSIQLLLPHLNKERLKYMFEKLFKAQQKIIQKVCFENDVELY